MENDGIFAKRLRNARIMMGYSMDDLVNAMGNSVSKMTISKLEREKMGPSSSMVIALSSALKVPVDYFFRPFTVEVDSLRFLSAKVWLSAKEENALKEKISDAAERYLSIEEICNASVSFVSTVIYAITDEEDVKKAAAVFRHSWNLGKNGIVSVTDLLEEHGIKVMETLLPSSFDGMSAVVNGTVPVVVLNSAYSPERKRFTLSHELGHLALSFDSTLSKKKEEKLCNIFASELLLPEDVFRTVIGYSRTSISYEEMKALQIRYGISCDALMYKARVCGIITESKYRSFCSRRDSSPDFRAMVEKSCWLEEKSTRFRSLVFRALSDELITLSRASNLLGEDIESIREDFTVI